VPSDRELWDLDRFPDFLTARRRSLADTANRFLGLLEAGSDASADLGRAAVADLPSHEPEDRDELLALVGSLRDRGYADPELDAEVADETTGEYLCTAEALWPNGLQEGIGRPIALELDEWEAHDKLAARGYDVFTSVDALQAYVERLEEGALTAD
jgi:hypothetical protein